MDDETTADLKIEGKTARDISEYGNVWTSGSAIYERSYSVVLVLARKDRTIQGGRWATMRAASRNSQLKKRRRGRVRGRGDFRIAEDNEDDGEEENSRPTLD